MTIHRKTFIEKMRVIFPSTSHSHKSECGTILQNTGKSALKKIRVIFFLQPFIPISVFWDHPTQYRKIFMEKNKSYFSSNQSFP